MVIDLVTLITVLALAALAGVVYGLFTREWK